MSRVSGINIAGGKFSLVDLKDKIVGAFGFGKDKEPEQYTPGKNVPAYAPPPIGWEPVHVEGPDGRKTLVNPYGSTRDTPLTPDFYGGRAEKLTWRESDPDSPYSHLSKHGWDKDAYTAYQQETGPNIGSSMWMTEDSVGKAFDFIRAYNPDLSHLLKAGRGGGRGGAAGRPVIPYKHHIDVADKLMGAMPQFQQAEALPLRWDLPVQPPTAGEPPARPERDRDKYNKLLGI